MVRLVYPHQGTRRPQNRSWRPASRDVGAKVPSHNCWTILDVLETVAAAKSVPAAHPTLRGTPAFRANEPRPGCRRDVPALRAEPHRGAQRQRVYLLGERERIMPGVYDIQPVQRKVLQGRTHRRGQPR